MIALTVYYVKQGCPFVIAVPSGECSPQHPTPATPQNIHKPRSLTSLCICSNITYQICLSWASYIQMVAPSLHSL